MLTPMANPEAGFPTWVDLGTSDLAAATAFYTGLFGWTANVSPDEQYGGYTIYTLDGAPVAGAGPLFAEGQPVTWSSYFADPDADATAERVEAAGGRVLVPPFDVGDQGRMAAFLDPAGAAFSVWQAGAMPGAEVFDTPGALTWTELLTRDVDGAVAFYGAVFGWEAQHSLMSYGPYTVWRLGDRPVAAMKPMLGPGWPTDLAPHWLSYFQVADCDAAVARAVGLGGSVSAPAADFEFGRFAGLRDPQGALFAVLQGS